MSIDYKDGKNGYQLPVTGLLVLADQDYFLHRKNQNRDLPGSA